MDIKENILISCSTYKDAFILRRALIDLKISSYSNRNFLKKIDIWYNSWNVFQMNTIYSIENGDLEGYCSRAYFYIVKAKKYDNFNRLTVKEFIQKYIRDYEIK